MRLKKKSKNLSAEDQELLDIQAFFDSLDLYHTPYRHTELFGLASNSNQKNITFHSYLAASDKISALGGLTQVYSEALIPNEVELKHYLDELGFIMQAGSGLRKDILGVVLSSFDHAMEFYYTFRINFRQIRNSLEHLPGLNEFSLSLRRPLSGHST
ncbi:TPA: hypothetical protein ACG2L8_002286 [Legionella pneumophila]|nr:hypothetical protein [Legionella pneumophila]